MTTQQADNIHIYGSALLGLFIVGLLVYRAIFGWSWTL